MDQKPGPRQTPKTMIQFLIQFLDPCFSIVSLRTYHPENWIGKLERKLDRPFRKIGSLESRDPILGPQPASQPNTRPASCPARRRGLWTSRPPTQPWLACRPAGWLGRWLAAWRAASQSCPAATQQAGWAAGWQACYDSQARSCSWLPDCFGWLALRGPLAGWTSQGPCHLHCSHPQCLQPKPHACDMKVGWSVLDHSLLWHASQDHHEGLCT